MTNDVSKTQPRRLSEGYKQNLARKSLPLPLEWPEEKISVTMPSVDLSDVLRNHEEYEHLWDKPIPTTTYTFLKSESGQGWVYLYQFEKGEE